MTEMEFVEALLRQGFVPNIPVFLITNCDGKTRFEMIRENDLWKRVEQGDYSNVELMTRTPVTDENGRWVGVKKKKAMMILKGGLLQTLCPPSGLN
jgi:hypothetical protein